MSPSWRHLAQLALAVSLLPGCFDSHGTPGPTPDAGPPGDAPARPDSPFFPDPDTGPPCELLPASVGGLGCELRGAEAFAVVTSSPTSCCSSGTPHATVESEGFSHAVALEWVACGCCGDCFCVGPTETIEVSLGILPPGRHTVTAGGETCTLDVGEPPVCSPGGGDEVRMPRGLYTDQELVTTVLAESTGGCGCDPTVSSPLPSAPTLGLELCSCCWACDCIDQGYEASAIGGVWPAGMHTVATPVGPRPLYVTTRDGASPREPIALRIVAPREDVVSGGRRVHWAVVTTVEYPCCVEPVLLVEEVRGPPTERVLSTASANLDDCACLGEPTEVEGWFPLVDLPSGRHVVRAGSQVAEIVIP